MKKSALVQPVILCGGSGTRLWPLSRAGFPKQFLSLFGKESLFQLAVERLAGIKNTHAPMVVSNEDHRFIILDQLAEIACAKSTILLEPAARNTAPALTLAACAALEDGDPVLVVTPADQGIVDVSAFQKALQQAIELAEQGSIAVLGIKPDRPETGYGYIRANMKCVEEFVEKPDLKTAESYVKSGDYFWNSGMFVLKASVWMNALQKFRPDIARAAQKAWAVRTADNGFIRPGKVEFEAVPAESIDYAVMEQCPGALDIQMVPLNAGWSDLGSWDAAWQTAHKDARGNAHTGDAMISGGRNVFVHASSRLVSVVGLENIVVVETPDAVLVTDRMRSQEVKQVVSELGNRAREEHTQHRKVHRPWGWYDSIDHGPKFKVKRILVKPGAALSLQTHQHRAEHWVVVSGTAKIQCGEKTLLLKENESTFIPKGERHRLSNPGTEPLEIIEVQSGDYLGEDDIVRLEDSYGRHQ